MDNNSPMPNVSSAPTPTPASTQIPITPVVPVMPKPPVVPITPPTMPMPVAPKTSMPASAPEHHSHLLPLLLVLLVVVLGYFWFQNFMNKGAYVPATTTATSTPKTVSDAPAPGVSVAQGGFPILTSSIVPPDGTITSNYSATYASHNLTQYTLTFTSPETVRALGTQYAAYLAKNGYVASTTTAASEASGVYSGTKGNDTLCFTITSDGNVSSVQVVLLEKGQ